MKVLVAFSYGISLERWNNAGYISREISLFKELLKKKNIEFQFLTYGTEKDLVYSDLLGKINIIPVKKYLNSRFPKFHFIKSLFLPFKLKSLFKEVDIIKLFQVYGSWIACIAKILFKKKVIIRSGFGWLNYHILSYKKDGLRNYIIYLLKYIFIFLNELLAYKIADGIISTSDQDVSFIVKCYKLMKKYKKKKIRHFYNFIDEELFKPLNIERKDKSVLFVGRLSRDKNLFNLIEAFKDLDGFSLDIIGAGREERKLKQKANELNSNINFLGIIPNYKIPEYLNQGQIFILPSLSEGNPTALLEAMSCGVACVGTDVKGINNIIVHRQNGYLCETNPESIRDAIVALYNDKDLRKKLGNNARRFILDNCTLSSIANKEYLFYKDILKE